MSEYPDLNTFFALSTEEVARLVRAAGPKTGVIPVNGTRRWFVLTYLESGRSDPSIEEYLLITGLRQIEVYQMLFDHGVDTLLTPLFGPDLLARGTAYQPLAQAGLTWFCEHPRCLDFYDRYQVRVRVYGDSRYLPPEVGPEELWRKYEALAQRTAHHRGPRLFIGVCAHDATETVAESSLRFHQAHGRVPTREEIVTAYYGEHVEPADLFIGFADCPAVFDVPLIDTSDMDVYFTVAPTLYMRPSTLRAILYDHLYARPVDDARYELTRADWEALGGFYARNLEHVLGVGRQHRSGQFWYPLPQVDLPPEW